MRSIFLQHRKEGASTHQASATTHSEPPPTPEARKLKEQKWLATIGKTVTGNSSPSSKGSTSNTNRQDLRDLRSQSVLEGLRSTNVSTNSKKENGEDIVNSHGKANENGLKANGSGVLKEVSAASAPTFRGSDEPEPEPAPSIKQKKGGRATQSTSNDNELSFVDRLLRKKKSSPKQEQALFTAIASPVPSQSASFGSGATTPRIESSRRYRRKSSVQPAAEDLDSPPLPSSLSGPSLRNRNGTVFDASSSRTHIVDSRQPALPGFQHPIQGLADSLTSRSKTQGIRTTTGLASRLQELASASQSGLLEDEEYRQLRTQILEEFARNSHNDSIVTHTGPASFASRSKQNSMMEDGTKGAGVGEGSEAVPRLQRLDSLFDRQDSTYQSATNETPRSTGTLRQQSKKRSSSILSGDEDNKSFFSSANASISRRSSTAFSIGSSRISGFINRGKSDRANSISSHDLDDSEKGTTESPLPVDSGIGRTRNRRSYLPFSLPSSESSGRRSKSTMSNAAAGSNGLGLGLPLSPLMETSDLGHPVSTSMGAAQNTSDSSSPVLSISIQAFSNDSAPIQEFTSKSLRDQIASFEAEWVMLEERWKHIEQDALERWDNRLQAGDKATIESATKKVRLQQQQHPHGQRNGVSSLTGTNGVGTEALLALPQLTKAPLFARSSSRPIKRKSDQPSTNTASTHSAPLSPPSLAILSLFGDSHDDVVDEQDGEGKSKDNRGLIETFETHLPLSVSEEATTATLVLRDSLLEVKMRRLRGEARYGERIEFLEAKLQALNIRESLPR